MQTARCPLSSLTAPEGVDVDADLAGEGRFVQAKLLPERDNLPRGELTFDWASSRALWHETTSGTLARTALARPKAHQEDHYEPVGSMDASTVLYR